MRCTRCGICCQETDMLLSSADITRLEQQGYPKDSFVRFDTEGYALLRNRQGHCVFYNPQEHRCNVYEFRPAGCQVYPVIFDEETGIVIDSICPAQETISKEEKTEKGKRVLRLLEQIDKEAENRR
ncbi:MAG: YkgJ family cysteine cluster protein [Candidatus Bathyarchaeota archaeon]|nr:YkgJ family cysteine cluster protein [Candidatus Bathyarchaeota archaeon]